MACAWENKRRAVEICSSGTSWQVNLAVYGGEDREFSTISQGTEPRAIFFKPDGTRVFFLDQISRRIVEYDLPTPWQVNPAAYTGLAREFYVGAEENDAQDIFFTPDGTRLFVVGYTDAAIVEYDLSTPWQVNTATYNGAAREFYIGDEDIFPYSIFFTPDGTRLFVAGVNDAAIVEYDLSTPWQVNTATYNGAAREFYVGAEATALTGIFFKPDGTRMFGIDFNDDAIVEYDLSTPWQVNTATYNGADREFYVGDVEPIPHGIFFKPDGTRMFILGSGNQVFVEYDL